MWFILAILGGGYLAYRHFHQGKRILPIVSQHKLTLSTGEIHAYGAKLLAKLAFVPEKQTSKEAVDVLKGFTKLDKNAIAHSALFQGASKSKVDATLLASELE